MKLIIHPHPILVEKAKRVAKIDEKIRQLILDMKQTLVRHQGLGLAAPQVGQSLRIFVIVPGLTKRSFAMINPEIKKISRRKEIEQEGCLSIPDVFMNIERHKKIIVEGFDENGQKIKIKAKDLLARVIQHEIDHLNGQLIIPRTCFMGTPEFALTILKSIYQSRYLILDSVVTKPGSPVEQFAKKQKIPVQYDFPKRADLIILAAYGKIIPKKILEMPKYGAINIHPSLLPKYRGASPIQAVLLNDEKETGITIILMDEKMDHGKIISKLKITPSETRLRRKQNSKLTYEQLSKKLARLGAELLIKILPDYLNGKIKPKPQDHKKATYIKMLKREDGQIDWQKSPQEIERMIRAYYPWPGTFTFVNNKRLKILKAHLNKKGQLIIDQVQPEGKRIMTFEEFLRGFRDTLPFNLPVDN